MSFNTIMAEVGDFFNKAPFKEPLESSYIRTFAENVQQMLYDKIKDNAGLMMQKIRRRPLTLLLRMRLDLIDRLSGSIGLDQV